MDFFNNFFKFGDKGQKNKFFPICGPGEMPYIKVIPKRKKVYCSESITKSTTISLDEITKISSEKNGSKGWLVQLLSGNNVLLTMKSKLSPNKRNIQDCFEFIKSIQESHKVS